MPEVTIMYKDANDPFEPILPQLGNFISLVIGSFQIFGLVVVPFSFLPKADGFFISAVPTNLF